MVRSEQQIQWRMEKELRRAPISEEDRLWRGGLLEGLQWVMQGRHWPEPWEEERTGEGEADGWEAGAPGKQQGEA